MLSISRVMRSSRFLGCSVGATNLLPLLENQPRTCASPAWVCHLQDGSNRNTARRGSPRTPCGTRMGFSP